MKRPAGKTTRTHAIHRLTEVVSWTLGATLCAAWLVPAADRAIGRSRDVSEFELTHDRPDQTLWSASRVAEYESTNGKALESPIALLRVPSLGLEVPVYARSTRVTLNRGATLVAGMGTPDRGGNVGIAGHRDGYFRALKDIEPGDAIELRTRSALHRYRVVAEQVVERDDTRLLADTEEPSLTLITCHPFYFVGPAPRRFIVQARYDWDRPASAPDALALTSGE